MVQLTSVQSVHTPVQAVHTPCVHSNCADIRCTGQVPAGPVHTNSVKIIKCGTMETEIIKTNVYVTNNNKSEDFRPRSKSDAASKTIKRPNFLNQLKMQRKMSCSGTSHRPMSPLVQVPLTIQENPKCEEQKKDYFFRPRSKSDAPSLLQRRNQRKNGTTTNPVKVAPGLSQIQENPGKGDKSSIKEEVSHDVQKNYIIDDDIKPEPRRRAATASQADEPHEFRERATSLGQSARARVTSIVRKLRHRSSDMTNGEEKKKKIKYYPSSEFVLDGKGGRGSSDNDIRRRTASISTPHRASDVQVDPEQSAILFRDARGLPAINPFLTVDMYDRLKNNEIQIFAKFFGFHRCYDLIPTSAKLVVFDTQLLVKKAFFALVYNGVRAAPLWDSQKQRFVGMLTITDFIRILAMNYKSPSLEMEELEEHKLETWRNVLKDVKELIYIEPNASLYDAIKSLIHNKIHRLPVIDSDTGNVLYILTHKRILRFLFLYINDLPESSILHQSVHQLNIGTYNGIEVAYEDTPIIEALHKFVNKRISALPIVDKQHRLLDIYAKFDVINLAAEKTYSNLNVSLKEANKHRNEWFEGVHKCTKSDSLYEVMDRIVKAEVHRLVIVDEDNVVCGMISLSDILNFLVLRPGGDDFTKKTVAETMKTEPSFPKQESDNIFDDKAEVKVEVAASDLAADSQEQIAASSPQLDLPEASSSHNDNTDVEEIVDNTTTELTCQDTNQEPCVYSSTTSDIIVDNREITDIVDDNPSNAIIEPSAEPDTDTKCQVLIQSDTNQNQDNNEDSLPDTLAERPPMSPVIQVNSSDICPLLIESASNSSSSSSPDPGRELSAPASPCPPALHNDTNILSPPASLNTTKEFGKSDSMDSAIEATEEVDEEEGGAVINEDTTTVDQITNNKNLMAGEEDERRVHIQIVDAGDTPEENNTLDSPTSGGGAGAHCTMAKLCDNMSGEKSKLSCDMTAAQQSAKLQQILP